MYNEWQEMYCATSLQMFEQILKLEANVIWKYGDASSHAYPLAELDTINQETGELNNESALSLIVYGVIYHISIFYFILCKFIIIVKLNL